jgi:hypothetical protein
MSVVETGRLMNRIGIGKYNEECNIYKRRNKGFDFIKYTVVIDNTLIMADNIRYFHYYQYYKEKLLLPSMQWDNRVE